jgi:hypothetical protein
MALLGVVVSTLTAVCLGFDPSSIASGLFGYNGALVGACLAHFHYGSDADYGASAQVRGTTYRRMHATPLLCSHTQVHTRVHTYTHTRTHSHSHTRARAHTHTHMLTLTHSLIHLLTHTCVSAHCTPLSAIQPRTFTHISHQQVVAPIVLMSALSSVFTAAVGGVCTSVFGLSPFTFPFVLAAWVWLAACAGDSFAYFPLDGDVLQPALPYNTMAKHIGEVE